MLRLFSFALGFFAVISICAFAQEKTVIEAAVNKEKVETGEIFVYTVKVEGKFFDPELILPEFSDFTVVSQNQAKNYFFENNKVNTKLNLTFNFFCAKPGKYVIKEVILQDKEKKFMSGPVNIEVTGKPLQEKRKILPYIERGMDI